MRRNPIRWWNPLTTRPPGRRRETFARPELECLEDRIVPAHNLAIDYVDTSGVSQTDDYSIRTFTATADDAVLNVADIQAAFDAGFDVVISTGEGGGSTGNIVWKEGADAYFTSAAEYPPFHSLTLQTDSLDTGRNVDIEAGLHGFLSDHSPLAALSILTGGPGGAVTLHQVDVAFGSISVTAGDAGIFLYGNLTTNGGDLTLTGNVLLEGNVEINTLAVEFDGSGGAAVTAAVSSASASFLFGGAVTVSGTIDGDGDMRDLRIFANAVSLDGDVGTTQHKLSSFEVTGNMILVANRAISVQSQFTLVQGTLDLNSQELTVSGQFSIGNGSTTDWATINGNGTIHADTTIQVASNGVISPGGLRNLGMLEIDGGIEFLAGSHFAVDLGDTPDLLHVTGAAQLDPGAMLVGASGVLNGAGPFQILTADGGLTGKFAVPNAPIGLADDLVRVSYTGTAVQVQPATLATTKAVGVTPDGTLYTIALRGGGNARLQVFESFKLGSALAYRTELRVVPFTVYRQVTEIVTEQVRAVKYETVPRDTGTNIVFVTIPVETVTEIDRTVYKMVAETHERQYSVLVPAQQEAFVHTLDIRVLDGTGANQLIISTMPNGGSGRLEVDSIIVQGALGALLASTTSVGSLQADRFIGDLRLTELRGPMTTGGSRLRQTSIAIGRINGDITTGTSIASFKSNQVGQVAITAPQIGRLIVQGDFNANLTLDAGLRSAIALGSANIAGGINGATWDIRGSVGQVVVKQAIQRWNFGSADRLWNVDVLRAGSVHESAIAAGGTIKTMTAVSWNGFFIQAQTIGAIQVAGSFSTDLTLDAGLSTARALGSAILGSVAGIWDIRGSVGPVTVKKTVDNWNLGSDFGFHAGQLGRIDSLQLGQVNSLSIFARGRIAALSAFFAASAGSRIHARSIGTLNVTGDFTGLLELDAGDESALAIETAHFTSIRESFWDIRGSLGEVTVAGSATDWGLGGNGQLGNIRKLKIGGTLHRSSIQAVGRIGSLQAAQWQITDVSARSLGSLTVTGGKPGGLPGDFLFSTVTLTGASKHVGLGTANIRGRVYGSTFNVMAGDVTTFTCGRFEQSRLYVGYVPVDPENFSLTGNFVDAFTLGNFTTTAMPLVPGQTDPRTDAFTGSQIVANRFGRVNLTSVGIQNGGTAFGLRVNGAANAGKVRINTMPFAPGVDVQPGTTKGDFQFLAS